ncbi:hypothetical protein PMZ80_002198 [Knufia obscura]|uniref:Uncharacterized protein n=2 Tax=Knufia TaxID=430999 RepID=A0AAN8ELE8_9EURO|nr:hypothetical protein PMZ80_002198 [Knufia obscura]KAK5954008.1 hypothetical protein OHC33_005280 [Knufia fluminis]
MAYNNNMSAAETPELVSSMAITGSSSGLRFKHQQHIVLQHIGAHQSTETAAAGAASSEQQELGHRHTEERPGLKAYVDGLEAAFPGHGSPVCKEVEDEWVKVSLSHPAGRVENAEKREANAAPWTMLKDTRKQTDF